MKRELTAAEEAKSYAKYYYRMMTPPAQEIYDLLAKGQIDPKEALPIQNRNDLLKPGDLTTERGYCIMPDGSGFIAMRTEMPGVTSEMINWWFAWHGLESLRYKIWDPDDHFEIHVLPEDLERRLDPNLDNRERNWGTTDIVDEDIGTGDMVLYISFMSPEDFGYDMNRFRAPYALSAVSANLGIAESKTPLATFSHFVREIPGGIEVRSRFWLGWNIVDKKPVRVADEIPEDLVRGLVHHCTKEYSNLAAILPLVYAENVQVADNIQDYK